MSTAAERGSAALSLELPLLLGYKLCSSADLSLSILADGDDDPWASGMVDEEAGYRMT